MIKKIFAIPLILFIAIVIACLFGIIHDHITYTISPEYYTKFKFSQFGLDSSPVIGNERHLVTLTGIIATWWVGAILGVVFSFTSLVLKTWKIMLKICLKAIGLTIGITALFSFSGYLCGKFILLKSEALTNIYDMKDFDAFIKVGAIHTASYIGGFAGMMIGAIYIVQKGKLFLLQNNINRLVHFTTKLYGGLLAFVTA